MLDATKCARRDAVRQSEIARNCSDARGICAPENKV